MRPAEDHVLRPRRFLSSTQRSWNRETLFTFNFTGPCNTNTVELLGSWDNFTNAYTMALDRRRGPTHWTGCFRFKNIIFDGRLPSSSSPRDGGLRQGGLYWYFFRLDDSIEVYDDAQELTSVCPLLPGQVVNVLEVPTEEEEEEEIMRPRSDSCVLETSDGVLASGHQYTLDPATKFVPLSPPLSKRRTGSSSYSVDNSFSDQAARFAEHYSPCSRTGPRMRSRALRRSNSRSVSPRDASQLETDQTAPSSSSDNQTQDSLGESAYFASRAAAVHSIVDGSHQNDTLAANEPGHVQGCHHSARHISTRDAVTMWRESPMLHSRLNDRCYRVSIPPDLVWAASRSAIVRPSHQFRGPVVS